jgi:hypothetical protein
MLRTIDEKMKPLRGFGLLVIHFSIDIIPYGKNIDECGKSLMNGRKIPCDLFAR